MAYTRTAWHAWGELISGDCSGTTLYTDKKGRIVAFPAAPPKKAPSPLVQWIRDEWATAMRAWWRLTPSQRTAYKIAARSCKLAYTGPGLWIATYFARDRRPWLTIRNRTQIPLVEPPPAPALRTKPPQKS